MQHQRIQVRRGGAGAKGYFLCDFFADVIFAKGMRLKNDYFFALFFFRTTPCAGNYVFLPIIRICTILEERREGVETHKIVYQNSPARFSQW